MAARRVAVLRGGPGRHRDAVRRRERLPRHARQRRGGPRVPLARHVRQRLPRDVAHPARGGGVRLRARRADDRQRPGRQGHPPLRGRRAPPAARRGPHRLRALARPPGRRPAARAAVAHAVGQARADPLAAHGVVRRAPPRGHDVRGHAPRRGRARRDLVPDPQPPGRPGRVPRAVRVAGGGLRPAQDEPVHRAGAAAADAVRRRRAPRAVLPLHQLRHDARRRGRRPARDRERVGRAHARRGRPREARVPRARRARAADPAHQARRVPHVARRAVARARRPLPAHARPGARDRRRGPARAPARVARRLLGPLRRRDPRPAGRPAGRALEPVPARAGHGARRGQRRPREGPHRLRVQRALLLGHRDLRPAVPHVHEPAVRAQRAALPLPDARRRPAPRRGAVAEGRALPLAHDQRRGGVRLLRGRDGAVPHRRRRELRARAVRARDRRRGLPAPRGRGHPRRDGAHVGGPRLLARQRRRQLPHPRRHRAGRVHDRRQRQPLHERHGALQPARRGVRRRAHEGRPPRGLRASRGPALARRVRGRGVGPRGRPHVDPVRREHRHPPAGLALPRARDLGPRAHARGQAAPPAALPPARHLPLPGAQAGRRRARAVPPGAALQRRGEARRLRVLRPVDHGRLDALGRRAVHRRGRGGVPRARARVLRVVDLRRPREPARQRVRRRARRVRGRHVVRARVRVRRHARLRGRPHVRPAPAPGVGVAHVPRAVARLAAARHRAARRDRARRRDRRRRAGRRAGRAGEGRPGRGRARRARRPGPGQAGPPEPARPLRQPPRVRHPQPRDGAAPLRLARTSPTWWPWRVRARGRARTTCSARRERPVSRGARRGSGSAPRPCARPGRCSRRRRGRPRCSRST